MKSMVFSVFDAKAGAFAQPFYSPTKGTALRAFMDCCADPNHAFCRHPSDYFLFRIAEFDDVSGVFDAVSPAEEVCKALDFCKE
jgi:hypothetical protein